MMDQRKLMMLLGVVAIFAGVHAFARAQSREITMAELENKIRGGMAGQMVGVTYGAPTEFRALGRIVDWEIKWTPEQVRGALNQDDLYVEMTFSDVMDRIGLDATTEQYGEAFRDSKYNLWHANAGARRHLNNGVAAPMSGHPKYNIHANDIDFQIEADFIGLMTPGLPQRAIELCDRVGRVMNYGDGVYGGMFVTGMYAAAFFESDVRKVLEIGMACMPEGSGYREIIKDTIAAHDRNPDDWTACWREINAKWDKHDSCSDGSLSPFNIDARLNGAYIAIGLLYGNGDFDKTLEISTRCGQDSDCNPASAAGVLGVIAGYDALDEKWIGGIDAIADDKFVFTNYSFNEFVDSSMKRALQAVSDAGGEVSGDAVLVPVQELNPPELEQWSMGVPSRSVAVHDGAWSWEGNWEDQQGRSRYNPAAKTSKAAGSVAKLEFAGSAISLVGRLSQSGGMADVFIDGKKMDTLNSYIIEKTTDTNLWHAYGLDDAKHTLRIVTIDQTDPRSNGKDVRIRRAVVYRPE